MRATEVTVNNIDNSYNQHMHVLVCVESTYFYNTENYVNQKQWIQFWKRAMKLDYDPNVKVQMIRPKNKHKSDIKSAIDETAKYTVKDTDFMTDDEERNLQRLADLEEGLYRKRLISYGGLLKEIHKELNLDDAEDGDLIHTDDEEKADEDGLSIIAMWNWERKKYLMIYDEEKKLQLLADLYEELKIKRLISYGGLLNEIHKELNLDDAEDGDLIHTDDEEKADEDGFSIIAMWNWERKNYFIKE